MRKVGILGGMMDPIHQGHIRIAQAALESGLDEVLLVPCQTPAHRAAAVTAFADRVAMCRLAAQQQPGITVSEIEQREGTSYSVDTVRLLMQQQPQTQFFWLLGADKLPNLAKWHEAAQFFTLCDILVCPRPGFDAFLAVPGARLHVLPIEAMNASSGQALAALHALSDAPALLAPPVARYIALHGLYQKDYVPILRDYGMTDARLTHTLGVRQTAVELAYLHGECMQKAALSAMLHDIAKAMPLSKMQETARRYALDVPRSMFLDANLLHGPVAAAIAEHALHITDSAVLSAIACHTTGKPGMSKLDMLLFLADAIEPNRRPYPGLDEIRRLARHDLRGAVLMSMQRTKEYVLSQGGAFFPQTEQVMRELTR